MAAPQLPNANFDTPISYNFYMVVLKHLSNEKDHDAN